MNLEHLEVPEIKEIVEKNGHLTKIHELPKANPGMKEREY